MTDYAIVVASALARQPLAFHSAAAIAEVAGIPEPTVRKVLRLLVQAQVVSSLRGSRGGYSLCRDASQTTVEEIVTAIEGPIAMTECCNDEVVPCEQELGCELRPNWKIINDAVTLALASITLQQMNAPLASGLVSLGATGRGKASLRPGQGQGQGQDDAAERREVLDREDRRT